MVVGNRMCCFQSIKYRSFLVFLGRYNLFLIDIILMFACFNQSWTHTFLQLFCGLDTEMSEAWIQQQWGSPPTIPQVVTTNWAAFSHVFGFVLFKPFTFHVWVSLLFFLTFFRWPKKKLPVQLLHRWTSSFINNLKKLILQQFAPLLLIWDSWLNFFVSRWPCSCMTAHLSNLVSNK